MGEATTEEVNGIGIRLNDLALKHADLYGRTNERFTYMENDLKEKSGEIMRIFQGQEQLNVAVAEIKSTIKTWGLVIGVLSPILAAIVSTVISKMVP